MNEPVNLNWISCFCLLGSEDSSVFLLFLFGFNQISICVVYISDDAGWYWYVWYGYHLRFSLCLNALWTLSVYMFMNITYFDLTSHTIQAKFIDLNGVFLFWYFLVLFFCVLFTGCWLLLNVWACDSF